MNDIKRKRYSARVPFSFYIIGNCAWYVRNCLFKKSVPFPHERGQGLKCLDAFLFIVARVECVEIFAVEVILCYAKSIGGITVSNRIR